MEKSNKKSFQQIIATIVILGLFLLLTVPVPAELKRITGLDRRDLRISLQQSDTLDVKMFWQWRDLTNGYFTFDPKTSHVGMTRRLDQPQESVWPLHFFTSRSVEISTDSLLQSNASQAEVLASLKAPYADSLYGVVAQGADFTFYMNLKTTDFVLVFVKPANELKGTDGLFDFTDVEQEYLDHAYWTNVTVIHKSNHI
ncbi:hypothetical protein KA012_00170 [Candidatus Woesebacteria bacterium]|nr:hypothetical protein [Candidatus Woesebacteria bacterium]